MKGVRFSKGIATVAALFLATLGQGIAHAQLSGATTSTAGATCSGGASADGDCRNSSAFTASSGTTFTSRYAWNINADTGVFSTHDTSGTPRHTLTFNATAVGGYRLTINARSSAASPGERREWVQGAADMGGVTGSSNIALTTGLSIGDPAGRQRRQHDECGHRRQQRRDARSLPGSVAQGTR
jgi:hypothetical protein